MLKITTLIENMPDKEENLIAEHGLSLYIEFQGKHILFDTGQSGDFLKNAEKLEKSLQDLDMIVISHGHYDHSGGVPALVKHLSKATKMYVGEGFFEKKYKLLPEGTYHYNGNPFAEEDLRSPKVLLEKLTEDVTYLTKDIMLFKNFPGVHEFERLNLKFFLQKGDKYVQDTFSEELVLGLRTEKGLVLVVGCSHVGICNILHGVMERVQEPIYAVLGGTHLVEADEQRLEKTIQTFRDCGISKVAESHCTGEKGILYAQEAFGKDFVLNNTGNVFEV